MGFGSRKQGKESVLEQQCLPGSQAPTAPAGAMGSPDTATRMKGEGGKQWKAAGNSTRITFLSRQRSQAIKKNGRQ